MRQVVLDTETTGLTTEEGHRIIEIGCIELVNRKITGKQYHQYIQPERDIDEGALAVHGITPEFLADKPVFSQIADEFLQFIQGAELIIHNAVFDIGFINYELKGIRRESACIKDKTHRVIDTLLLARQLHAGQRNNLDALCKRYNVDNSQRDLHGALKDADLLARVYLAMTGGQGNLFDELDHAHETVLPEQQEQKLTQRQPRKLRVLMATGAELEEHQKHVSKLGEKSGW